MRDRLAWLLTRPGIRWMTALVGLWTGVIVLVAQYRSIPQATRPIAPEPPKTTGSITPPAPRPRPRKPPPQECEESARMQERIARRDAFATNYDDCEKRVKAWTSEWFVKGAIKQECGLLAQRLEQAKKDTEVCDHHRK